MCSCVRRGWEALAEQYINKFVKWAGVVEYLCVSVCVCVCFFCECYLRFSHHEAQKPHAAVLHNTFCFSSSSRTRLLLVPLCPSVSRAVLDILGFFFFCYDISDFLCPYRLCKITGFWINSLRKCRVSHWQIFSLLCWCIFTQPVYASLSSQILLKQSLYLLPIDMN